MFSLTVADFLYMCLDECCSYVTIWDVDTGCVVFDGCVADFKIWANDNDIDLNWAYVGSWDASSTGFCLNIYFC